MRNTIADGSGNTADFSQLDITAATTVDLNDKRTIGNLIFGDTDTSSPASWILTGYGGELTLAGGKPTIMVNPLGTNAKTTISAVINGSSGLTKAGEGILLLTGSNTFTAGVVIEDGSLQVTSETPLTNAGAITIGNGSGKAARLSLSGDLTLTNAITIGSGASGSGNGAIMSSSPNAAVSGDITITDVTPGSGHFFTVANGVLTLQGKITYAGNTVTQRGGTVIYSGRGSDYASIQTMTAGSSTITGLARTTAWPPGPLWICKATPLSKLSIWLVLTRVWLAWRIQLFRTARIPL